jgi:hypothetical protein
MLSTNHNQFNFHSNSKPSPHRQNKKREDSFFNSSDTAGWIIVLSLLAYPLFGIIVAFTSLPSLAVSIPVRLLILLLSLSLILGKKRFAWKSNASIFLFLFWTIYLVRLLWDWQIVGIPLGGQFTFSFLFFCVPTAIVFLNSPSIDSRKLSLRLLMFGIPTCIFAFIAAHTDFAGVRSFTKIHEDRLFLETVNPISLGHAAVTTLIAAISTVRYCTKKIELIGLGVVVMLCLLTVQLSGSRGPLFALVTCYLVVLLVNRRNLWISLFSIGIGLFIFVYSLEHSQILLVERIKATIENGGAEERVAMAAGALQQFFDNPLFGSAIVELGSGNYPHNPWLEAPMALGIIGLVLMTALTFKAVVKIIQVIRRNELLMPLLAIQAIVGALFSGSLSGSVSMWIFLVLFSNPYFYAGHAIKRCRGGSPTLN